MNGKSQTRTVVVFGTLIVVLLSAAVMASIVIDTSQARAHPEQEVLYIPSAKVLKRMSLGYTGLMADIYWTRAVQYFGWRHRNRAADYSLLYPLLDITTELDPNLIVAYRFGGIFLAQRPPNGAGEPDKAVELLEHGIKNNPDQWTLYYDLGFLQALELHDYLAAAKSFERGSRVPNAHPSLRILAASMAQHGGDLETARLLWTTTLETTQDAMIRQNAEKHLRALDVNQTVPRLEAIIKAYHDRTGVWPTSFFPLISAGVLRGIPVDPLGHPYKLQPDGTIQVQDPDSLPFITEGLPPGYKAKVQSVPGIGM